jgi:DNA-binding response OmpR family regulator
MARLLLLSSATESPLPAMSLLSHAVVLAPFTPLSVATHNETDIVILDGVGDLVAAKAMAVLLRNARIPLPVVLALPETSLPVIDGGWGVTDFLTPSMSLMEIDSRIRLALSRREFQSSTAVSHSGVRIDEASFQAHAGSRALDLTFKEFELLRFLVANPGRVFSREQLLAEVWGYDYFGGTRTVDVHVRRLRAKLGDHESVVGTVRNVGYRFAPSGEGDE